MDRTLRNCVKFHSAALKSRVTRADTGAVPAVTPRNPRADQIMKTRKQKAPVSERARRPTKRGAARRPAAARGKAASATPTESRSQEDGSLTLAAECTVAQADSLRSQLARRLDESGAVTVDVSAVQRIDTAGLQLLAAFVRDRRTAGRAVEWRGRASALDAAAGLLGLRDMLELPAEAGR
jgi:ABC-type transporter Mla MlaB component